MFQSARMRKINIITHDSYLSQTVNDLHEEGILQINDISDRVQQDPELAKLMKPSKVHPLTGQISSLLMKTTSISELFGDSLSEKAGMMDMVKGFLNLDLPDAVEIDDLTNEELIEKAESLLAKVEPKTRAIEDKISGFDLEKAELTANLAAANSLVNLDVDLSLLNDSKYSTIVVGRVESELVSEMKDELSKLNDELIINDVPDNNEETDILIIVSLKEYKDEIYSIIRKYNFDKFDLENVKGTPKQIIDESTSKLNDIEQKRAVSKDELFALATEKDHEILVLKELLENAKERNEISSSFLETRETKMLEAWVPLKEVDKFEEVVKKSTEGYCVYDVVDDIGKDDEYVPTLHDNPRFAKPYEFLVELYAPLRYNTIDPTILVAIIFPFFFGFCVSDSFYGLIILVTGLSLMLLVKGDDGKTLRAFGEIFVVGGIWTIIVGLVTNGVLGDFLPRFLGLELPTVIPWLEAFLHPDTILIIAIGCGIVYTNIGLVIGLINNIRYGYLKEALSSQIVWFVLQLGIILAVLSFLIPSLSLIGLIGAGVALLVTVGILIYGVGIFGLMNIFGFAGDILSYARLLALCLATGGIAMTVNILAELCIDMIPFIGILLFVVVFIVGHIANLLIQVLGAFINTLRLHYVEFFSQFYLIGKSKFEAFKSTRCFTKIKN